MDPLVSIIIPVFNRVDLLLETLESIKNQAYQNWECIIVDDGSTDNTYDVMEKFASKDKRFRIYKRPDKYLPGANGARNYGLDLSKGDFIQWFDSDDIMNTDFLSAKVDAFQTHPETQSVVSRFTFFDGSRISPNQLGFRKVFPEFYENMIAVKIPVWTSSVMFRRKFLIAIGERFDESLKRLQDYEFFSRIFIKYPHKVFLLNKSLCLEREHENAKTATFNVKKDKEMYETFYDANHKIISLLLAENKFTNNLENFFYSSHIKYISYSHELGYDNVQKNLSNLVISYLKNSKSYSRLLRFRIGYFLFSLIPVQNFFLVYEIKNPVVRSLTRNTKRVYKVLFKKGYLMEQLKK